MATTQRLNVNGKRVPVTIDDPDMPLLYALRDNLALHGPRFGCGLAQCGACTVHVDGKAVRSCVTPLSTLTDKQKVVTLEGLGTPEQAASGAARLHRGAGRAVRLLHQRHDHGVGRVPRAATRSRARPRSSRRSPTTSAAAARMPASCARSSARRATREGGSHDQAFHPVPPRPAQGRRRADRQLLARRPHRRRARARRRGGEAARAHRGRCLPRHRRQGHGARSIPARSISAPASHTALRQIVADELDVPMTRVKLDHRRHRAHARPGQDLGQPHHPDRRHADCATPRRPRGPRCSKRRPSGSASSPKISRSPTA